MRDLTQGPVSGHLLNMAAFIGAGLIVQTLYVLVDLYFVSHLGEAAMAGVASAGTVSFLVLALTQLVAVGSLSLIAQAIGRKDVGDAQLVFEQALTMALAAGVGTLVVGAVLSGAVMRALASDAATAQAGRAYLLTFLPSLAMMFLSGALGSALRATGVVGVPMLIQVGSLLLNVVLAPVLIAGWGTGHPLGVAGAGLASSIAAIVGVGALGLSFNRIQARLRIHATMRARPAVWRRIAAIGVPSSADFLLLFLINGVVYWAIRGFGPVAQAGFGIGARVMQSIFLPAMAVAFAVAPVVGQNFGARAADRVRATFLTAALISSAMMLALTFLCRVRAELLVAPFATDPAVIRVATDYLRIISINFVASAFAFTCSGLFQGLGDTRPSLISSGSRILTYVVPLIWLSQQPWIALHDFWWLSVASTSLQAVVALLLARRELRRKLVPLAVPELALT